MSLIFPFNISSTKALKISHEITFLLIFSVNSSFLIISLYNFKKSFLFFNQLIFFDISFLISFSLFKKVPVSLCMPFISNPLGSYSLLVSLCLPSISNPLRSYISSVSLCMPFISNALGSYSLLVSLCLTLYQTH